MLIDIFARRYEGAILRSEFDERDARVLVQAFRILSEDMYPYFINGKTSEYAVTFWTNLHKRLSRELGLTELSPQWFHYTTKWNGQETAQTHKKPLVTVCEEWMLKPVSGLPDQHLKDRLSLIELGFRERENEIATMLAQPETNALQALAATSTLRVPGSPKSAALSYREGKVAAFRTCVDELNARFRHAALPLNYHNGFIQIATDDLVQREVETPFWTVVSGPEWANVDLDMKQALDLRDSDGRDPALCRTCIGKHDKDHFRPQRLDARQRERRSQLHR